MTCSAQPMSVAEAEVLSPAHGQLRAEALRRYGVLDTPREQAFDDLVAIAARSCAAPVAYVALLDHDRCFVKAEIGLGRSELPLQGAFCIRAASEPQPLVVADLAALDAPSDPPGLRFCAGTRLQTADGLAIGALVVADTRPRGEGLTRDQAETLQALARQVMVLLEHRRVLVTLAAREAELDRIQEISGVGGLEVDLRSGFRNRRSPRYLRIHGLSPGDEFETHQDWVRRIHPEERQAVERAFLDAVAGSATIYRAEYRIIRPSDGAIRWINAVAEIERDAEGRAQRLVGAHRDVTERRQAEEALRTTDERLQLALSAAGGIGLWVWDVANDRVFADRAFARIFGVDEQDVSSAGTPLQAFIDAIHPDDRALVAERIRRAMEEGVDYDCEYRVMKRDGGVRWVSARGRCERDAEGRPTRFPGAVVDITSRKRVEAELAARTEQLEALLETAPMGVWFTDDMSVRKVMRNSHASDLMGVARQSSASLVAQGAEGISHVRMRHGGEVAPPRMLPLQRALRGDEFRDEEYELEFTDGRPTVTILASASALRDAQGAVRGAISVGLDITARKRTEEARELLAGELSHRIKNIFAVVGGLISLSERSHPGSGDFAEALRQRLNALAQAHDYVRQDWQEGPVSTAGSHTIQGLIELLLAPYAGSRPGRMTMTGEDVWIGPKSATALALCLHEQATNAAKYGALSVETGRLEIHVTQARGRVTIIWREVGGPPVLCAPQRRGFGTMLATRSIAGQLGGTLEHDWRPDGLVMRLEVDGAALRL